MPMERREQIVTGEVLICLIGLLVPYCLLVDDGELVDVLKDSVRYALGIIDEALSMEKSMSETSVFHNNVRTEFKRSCEFLDISKLKVDKDFEISSRTRSIFNKLEM